MIVVAGTVKVKSNTREEAAQAALKMAAATQTEAGCIAYQFYTDLADPNTFFIFEVWESEVALTQHFQTDHMRTFQQELPKFVADEMAIKRYDVTSVSAI